MRSQLLKNYFESAFKIKVTEFRLVQSFFLYFTIIGIFYTIGTTTGDTLLLSRFGSYKIEKLLPMVYIGIAAASIIIIWLYDIVQNKFPRIQVIIGSQLLLGISLIIFRYIIWVYKDSTLLYYFLVIWEETCSLISIMLFFSYTGDYFTARDARRLYGYITGGLALGTFIGGYSLSRGVKIIGIENLLLVAALLQVFTAYWSLHISRRWVPIAKVEPAAIEEKKAPLKTVFQNRYILLIIIIVITGLICFSLTEFQFHIYASKTYRETELASFFGSFYGYIGITQLFLQFLIVGRLLNKAGVIRSLLVLPVLVIGGTLGFLLHPSLLTSALVYFIYLSLSETLDLPSRELLFLILPGRIRIRTQAILSGLLVPLGGGLAGVLLLSFPLLAANKSYIAFTAILITLAWISGLISIIPAYRKTLSKSLKQFSFNRSEFHDLLSIPGSGKVVSELLKSNDEGRTLFILDLISRESRVDISPVRELVSSENIDIAEKAFEIIGAMGNKKDIDILKNGIGDKRGRIGAAALTAYASLFKKDSIKIIKNFIHHKSRELQQAAIAAMIRQSGNSRNTKACKALNSFLLSNKVKDRMSAAMIIGLAGGKGFYRAIAGLLKDRSKKVRSLTASICTEIHEPELIGPLIKHLDEPDMHHNIIQALSSMPPSAENILINILNNSNTKTSDKAVVIKILSVTGGKKAAEALWEIFKNDTNMPLRVVSGHSLRIMKEKNLVHINSQEIDKCLGKLVDALELLNNACEECAYNDPFSAGLFGDRIILILDLIFTLLIIEYQKKELQRIYFNLSSKNRVLIDNSLELLSIILPGHIKNNLITLINRFLQDKKQEYNGLEPITRDKLLKSDDWLKTACYYHIAAGNIENIKGEFQMNKQETRLFHTISNLSFLKGVELFKEIPMEFMTGIAEIAEEVVFYKGETIFHEGEPGDSLYIIREGLISIEKSGVKYDQLGTGEIIGEMAILDGQPRSATCIAAEEAKLVRISLYRFLFLIDTQPELAKALLRTLTRRFRNLISQLG